MSVFQVQFANNKIISRRWLTQHPDVAQNLLRKAKDSQEYPLCLCRSEGIPLYIGLKGQYYLARMPRTGALHHPKCPEYSLPYEDSGLMAYTKAVIHEDSHQISVRLNVSLGSGAYGKVNDVTENDNNNVSLGNKRSSMTLLGLLHLLWERAGFNVWTPKMRGKRHYAQIYKYLRQAALSNTK